MRDLSRLTRLIEQWNREARDVDPSGDVSEAFYVRRCADELAAVVALLGEDRPALNAVKLQALRDEYWNRMAPKDRERPDYVYTKFVRELDEVLVALLDGEARWQPIETAPKDTPVFFWLVPKTPDESYCDSSGRPIVSPHQPYRYEGKFNTWSSLSKATHWMPLPAPPSAGAIGAAPQEKP